MEIIQNDKDINAIRAQYGEHWGEWHGNVDGGEPRLFFLNDGAHIEFVEGKNLAINFTLKNTKIDFWVLDLLFQHSEGKLISIFQY